MLVPALKPTANAGEGETADRRVWLLRGRHLTGDEGLEVFFGKSAVAAGCAEGPYVAGIGPASKGGFVDTKELACLSEGDPACCKGLIIVTEANHGANLTNLGERGGRSDLSLGFSNKRCQPRIEVFRR